MPFVNVSEEDIDFRMPFFEVAEIHINEFRIPTITFKRSKGIRPSLDLTGDVLDRFISELNVFVYQFFNGDGR